MYSQQNLVLKRVALLDALAKTCVLAGEAIMSIYQTQFAITTKADESPLTEADTAAENIILAALTTIAPDIAIIAEEQFDAGCATEAPACFFLVDPLDGTKEFIERRGDFTVNIALIENYSPSLGVVYAPAERRLFSGDVSAGNAWSAKVAADGTIGVQRSIRIREAPRDGITAVASRSHSSVATDEYLAQYFVSERVSRGSSLKICMVAAGEADLYPRLSPTCEWDIAAGDAVLRAAGGTLKAIDGKEMLYGKANFFNACFVAAGDVSVLPVASFIRDSAALATSKLPE